MLSFAQLSEKTTKVKINPKVDDIKEGDGVKKGNHGEDCDCMKCEKKRRKGDSDTEITTESAVPGKPAEKVGALTNIDIPQSERDAAKARLLAKAKAKREKMKESYYDPMEDDDFDHDEAERTRGQSGKNKSITIKKKTKKTTKEEIAYVSQEEVSEESNQSFGEEETEILTFAQHVDEGVKGAIKGAVKGAAKGAALGALGAAGVTAAGLTGGAAIPAAAAAGAITHGAYNAAKGASQNDKLYKLRQADQKKRDAKLLASASKTKKESANLLSFGNFTELNEGRAEDAQKSLDALKKRQSVLDAHEKMTGKKLDITKTPEHKAHKKEFPGSRQPKKVKGAKETPLETQNRRVNRSNARIVSKGYSSKEKKEVDSMAKHTSRYD